MSRATAPVLITWVGYDPAGERTGARLTAAGLAPRLAPKTGARTPDELGELLEDAVGAIVSTDPFDEAVLASARRLRVIARVGVGTDSVDLAAATAHGVVVTTTPGLNQETTADHAIALLLAALRRVPEHDASVRRGEWERAGGLTPWDLHGATVGLVGCGAIGRKVARRLAGFAVRLLVCDPAPPAVGPWEIVDLPTLLEHSDVVSLHLPLTAATRGLIGADSLAAMRSSAVLVNTSRGGLVDERALHAALAAGRLRAAALDVFADEPAVPPELAALPNVVLTPHIGGLSERSIARMTERATQHVLDVLRGTPDPAAVANPDVLKVAA
jgi:phosphoglycerate dehydrogenase-like enzyme